MSLLIEADDLSQSLDDPALRLLDCRFDLADPDAGRRSWREGHIPGAVYAHLDHDLAGPVTETSGRHPLPDREAFAEWLGRKGIASDSRIVVYDASNSAIAARAWWLLRWAGAVNVQVLNGGYRAWLTAGGSVVKGEDAGKLACNFQLRPGIGDIITTEEILANADSGQWLLVDARDSNRFRGEVEPLDAVAGHIPGSRNLPFSTLIDSEGRFRPPEVLGRRWSAVMHDLPSDASLAVTCGSGVTACHLVLSAMVAGLPAPRLYAGSWSEWIRDPDRPVERSN